MTPRTCGVLGDPIEHSLSPVLHRAGYAALGLDWTYDAHRVPAGGLTAFLAGLDQTWRGLSLTMPLKREAMALVTDVTPHAAMSGAVNTLVLDDGVRGHNTDLPGAMAAIGERTDRPPDSAVVLGGGATATSVGLALCELGVTSFTLLVRSADRAEETRAALAAHPSRPEVRIESLAEPALGAADIVVSTIPAAAQDAALVSALAAAPCLFDVLYDPWPTPLAAAAEGVVVSGLDLLVHQAALQFTLFTGLPAPLAVMRAPGERALSERGAR
ncbi:shikimate dehydrogenase [Nocardioides sp. 616]|uniref:shikimate dehydrogenase n=1 Tax=Nocardioides sp. 616 TaxID=2268090 RepID=UPI000CE2B786|nr:shikimate dehydrogenase [Nocardioides sp. 616]